MHRPGGADARARPNLHTRNRPTKGCAPARSRWRARHLPSRGAGGRRPRSRGLRRQVGARAVEPANALAGTGALSYLPGSPEAGHRASTDTQAVHSSPSPSPASSPELKRRLRARARRVSVLRRRIGALTVTMFLAAWLVVAGLGWSGKSSTVATLTAPGAHAARVVKRDSGAAVSSGDASSASTKTSTSSSASSAETSTSSSASSPSAVTTAQS